MEIFGRGRERRHEYVHADRPAEGEQAQEPERNGASATKGHRATDRLRSVVSGRGSARLKSRPLTVSSRRSERVKSSSKTSPRTDVANFLGYALDLINGPASARGQREAFRAPVGVVLASLDEARMFKRIEQTNDRGSVERQGSGQFVLPHRRLGPRDPKQRQPRRLRQPIGLQAPVDRAPPLARHVGDERRQPGAGVFWGKRHGS